MNNYLKKDINLFAAVGKDRGAGSVDFENSLKKTLVVFVAIFAVCLVACLGLNGTRQLRINKLNEDMAALLSQLAEIDGYRAESEQLQADIDNFNTAISEFDVSPRLTIADIQAVAVCRPADVTLQNFNYSDASISMSVTGGSELSIADFANSLRNSGYFKSVTYGGVRRNDASYSGEISLELKDIVAETTTETTETTTAAQ